MTNSLRDEKADNRYPYTYAADLIRSFVGPNLSRSDASSVWHGIAEVLGLDEQETAEKLANYYKLHEEEIGDRFLRAMGINKESK